MNKITKKIEFSNVRLNLSIGIHEFERKNRQTLAISLIIDVTENEESDDIAKTLDYDQVYNFLKNLEKTDHFDLQETVCRQILDYVLGLPTVEHVKVSTAKTDVYENTDFVGLTMSARNE